MPTQTLNDDEAVAIAAKRLLAAEFHRMPCPPIRDVLSSRHLGQAYAVQAEIIRAHRRSGRVTVGHKIGLTSPLVQEQIGVDQPDSGMLFADMRYAESDVIPFSRLLQPKIEVEVGFVLGRNLDDNDLSIERVRDAIAYAVPSLEIVDSRVAGWDIELVDTVADNASSGLFVLGDQRLDLGGIDLATMRMRLHAGDEEVSTGIGAACMGNPLNAVLWLAETARRFGEPLKEGDIILSGALGPMVSVQPGSEFVAELEGLGTVRARFSG